MIPDDKNIVLIGMRGSGKTTVGASLAGRLHREFIPMDALIVYEAGMTIPEIVAQHGWDYFRDIETKVARKTAALKGIINATGGGVVLRDENVQELRKTGVVIWLRVSVEQSLQRIGEDPNRPSLTGRSSRRDDLIATMQEREPLYKKAAHFIVDTDKKTQTELVDDIWHLLNDK